MENKPHIFFANYQGIKSDEISKQTPEKNVSVRFANLNEGKVFYLPYLREKVELKSEVSNGNLVCTIPLIEKGGVLWVE